MMQFGEVTPTGLEQHKQTPRKMQLSESRGTESGTVGADLVVEDIRLRQIIDAWPMLSEGVKEGVAAIIKEGSRE